MRTLLNDVRAAGTHTVAWSGLDDAGHAAKPVLYFARLEANGAALTRRVVLLP